MSELATILKGNKQKNVVGAVLADRNRPPFAERRDGYRLRWWGTDHPASEKVRALVGADDGGQEPGSDGFQPGDTVGHVDFPEFRAEFVRYDDGKAKVFVVGGWLGLYLPTEPVSVPRRKLVKMKEEGE